MEYSKIDPALLRVWRAWRRDGVKGARRFVPRYGVLFLSRKAEFMLGGPEVQEVWVEVSLWKHPDIPIEPLNPAWRVSVSSTPTMVNANVVKYSARLPLQHVEDLLECPGVLRLVLSRQFR